MSDEMDELKKHISFLSDELFECRRTGFGLLMAFVHLSTENNDYPVSWLLAYLVNNDKSILEMEHLNQWPPGYFENVEDFCDLMSLYIGPENNFPPVLEAAQSMKLWTFQPLKNKTIH